MDIIYGGEIKNSTDIEFRYTDPKKLKEIEKFFIEFYLSNKANNDVFYENNHELKYFNYNIISIIEEVVSAFKGLGFDNTILKINTKLRDIYVNMSIDKFKYPEGVEAGSLSGDDSAVMGKGGKFVNNNPNNSDLGVNNNLNTNFLNIKKEFIIREIFKEMDMVLRVENGLINKNNDNTLCLSKLSDDYFNNDHSFQFSKQLSNISFLQDETLNQLSYKSGYGSALIDDTAIKVDAEPQYLSPIMKGRIIAKNISNKNLLPNKLESGSNTNTPYSFNPNKQNPTSESLLKLQQSLSKDEKLRSHSNNDIKMKLTKQNTFNSLVHQNHQKAHGITDSPTLKQHSRHNSQLLNKYYVKLSNNSPTRQLDKKRNSVQQDLAYNIILNNKPSNIYYNNVVNTETDHRDIIPGFVLSNQGQPVLNTSNNNIHNDHSFAARTSSFRNINNEEYK
jgi:hypothetical protein